MVYVNRAGALGRPRNLAAAYREAWEASRSSILAEIDRRTSSGVPLSDEPDGSNPLEDPGEAPIDEAWGSISVVLRVMSPIEAEEHDLLVEQAAQTDPSSGDWRDALAASKATRDGWDFAVRHTVARLEGLEDERGPFVLEGSPLSLEDLDVIHRAGLVIPLVTVGRAFQRLSEEDRGNFGRSLPRTSAPTVSTAADAPHTEGPSSGATVAGPPHGTGEREAGGTNPAYAPSGSIEIIHGPGGPSTSTSTPEAA